jgi:hypothetical protein
VSPAGPAAFFLLVVEKAQWMLQIF